MGSLFDTIHVRYFCPDCLVQMEDDFEWDDVPTLKCPKCGMHDEEFEPIEATALTEKAVAEKRQEFIKLVKDVLRTDADHFWIPFHNDVIHPLQYSRGPWITGEWRDTEDETDKPYVFAALTTKVDTLGYCYGEVPMFCDIEDGYGDESIGECFDYLIGGLDMYGCDEDGVLVSHPRKVRKGELV